MRGVGAALAECLEALEKRWQALRDEAEVWNRGEHRVRRGMGIACMWYGIGNTSMLNPSDMTVDVEPSGRAVLLSGVVDIGQGRAPDHLGTSARSPPPRSTRRWTPGAVSPMLCCAVA